MVVGFYAGSGPLGKHPAGFPLRDVDKRAAHCYGVTKFQQVMEEGTVLTVEENERLTRVGPGTPMGHLMRRYWQPIVAVSQMETHATRPIRLLGENLVLYKDRQGRLGLIGDRCPHRKVNMIYGIPDEEGLRCPYHGWLFNHEGRCLEQPYEKAEDPAELFKDKVCTTAYPVQELGGLIFAYLGPEPVPLLPRWDLLVWDNVYRDIGMAVLPCNWLQIMENSVDPVHAEWLHGHFVNYVWERLEQPERIRHIPAHELIGFDVFEYGIIKRRILRRSNPRGCELAAGASPGLSQPAQGGRLPVPCAGG